MTTIHACEELSALTEFSVGTLDDRDAMMVLQFAPSLAARDAGLRYLLPLIMNPAQARELASALLLAVESVHMGAALTDAVN